MSVSRASSALLLAALLGCGGATGSTTPEDDAVETSGGEGEGRAERDTPQPEVELALVGGRLLYLSDLRGQPVLLFLFATFDGASQATLPALTRFAEAHPEVQMVGIAIQPDARRLAPIYEQTLEPPFRVTFDPSGDIAQGQSELGIVTVPMLYLFDEDGHFVAQAIGYQDDAGLTALYDQL